LLVLDPAIGELPETLRGATLAATSSAIAIGTLAELDGETEVHFTDTAGPPAIGNLARRWDGILATSGRLSILTTVNEVVAEFAVPDRVHVQVWTNDAVEPDLIWVSAS
jgi:hypothetical protein